jgi:phosphoglucomutase
MINSIYTEWQGYLKGTSDGDVLASMSKEEAAEAFSGELVFGTGGLRGIMGLGANRVNTYTIRRVTLGLSKVIMVSEYPKNVCVTYDTRHNSRELAQTVCEALGAFGITTYIFERAMPTPMLSFMIRHMKLGWGVAITASHNPKEYNGYKVYNSRGVQITDDMAKLITEAISSTPYFKPMPEIKQRLITTISAEMEAAYFDSIITLVQKEESRAELPIVYSALHGTGANAVPFVLKELGFSPVCLQQNPDSTFGGIKTPNPEEQNVFEEAIKAAEDNKAKLLLATDPDCDRVGVMIKSQHSANSDTRCTFRSINGNQIGALLIDYLAQVRGVIPGDTVITTIVSGLLGQYVSDAHGLDFKRVLTGFKYIGEYAEKLPEGKRFFFGYEESCGFLAGDGARDKDAVIASALIAKMAAFHGSKGKSLLDRLNELYEAFGYCLESLHSMEFSVNVQRDIMDKFRNGMYLDNVVKTEDHLPGFDGLPPADVVKYYFDFDGVEAWAAVRPSGTEPKLKIYTGVRAKSLNEAEEALEELQNSIYCGRIW